MSAQSTHHDPNSIPDQKREFQYPKQPILHFEYDWFDQKSNILELKMYGEDDTLGALIVSVLSTHLSLDFISYHMNHPFQEDMKTKMRICSIVFRFPEQISLHESRQKVGQAISSWRLSTFDCHSKAMKKTLGFSS